jgi:beta-barrel assembly-enhancing protease
VQAVIRRFAAALAMLALAGCAAETGKTDEGGKSSWRSTLSIGAKGEKATLISGVKSGAYEASSLAIGGEKDIAQRRGEGLGFMRSTPIEQYLGEVRSKLLSASGVTGVPGRVMVLANPAFAAFSTPDGNVYVALGWLQYVASADETAAILAHELSHVLLKHHSSDLIAGMQRKGQAFHEIAVNAKTALSGSKKVAKSDARGLANEQLIADVTDKLAMPAWNRRQEREADLLGVDLLIGAGYFPGAMTSMLEKFQAWEKQNKESEEAFGERLKLTAQQNPGEMLGLAYQRLLEAVSTSHPKTDERMDDVAEYLDRHYADAKLAEPRVAPWKAVASRPDVAQVMRNYDLAFSAKKMLEKGKTQDAYAFARTAATGRTATDAYPNWVLARSAESLGRQREAVDALRRAISSPEPVPQIYEEMVFLHEQAGNIGVALEWTDKASATFGHAPRWTPPKIRLLRKAGRAPEAEALTLNCSLSTPEWKRQCQEANQTPAGRSR